MIAAGASVLDARVLVINKLYNAVRVVDARRAFTMLCKGSAEIISVEAGAYVSYSLHSWTEVAEFQRSFEHEQHDWVTTPRLVMAVPKIIRLLGYDRLPREPGGAEGGDDIAVGAKAPHPGGGRGALQAGEGSRRRRRARDRIQITARD